MPHTVYTSASSSPRAPTPVQRLFARSPRDMSSDADSPFPDRPIRPLPKKSLRDRISPDVAKTIHYPPVPKTTTPLFYYGYNPRDGVVANGLDEAQHPSARERAAEIERNYIERRNVGDLDSDEDEQAYRSRIYARPSADTTGRSYRYVQKPDSRPNPQPPASTASSADGYDSFENTNNKKKRKIPTSGDSNLNGARLSSDLAGMGISGTEELLEDTGAVSYHVSPNGQGISGPGRGRYGRIRNARSPLRTLDASSNWGNGRTSKQRQWPPSQSTGIITESIATANAEKFPPSPGRGQENVSILEQQASKKAAPASTQFTFTCNSQVPSTLPWPGHTGANMNQSPAAARMMSTHATQTSPSMPGGLSVPAVVAQAKQGLAASQQQQTYPPKNQSQVAPKKHRRRTGKEYLVAARQRRENQRWQNEHRPIPKEDQWTCEFCEYEQIFGSPPVALIRQYEIKDRNARKQALEKKRLLEKAKQRGKKGKKGSKAAPKPGPVSNDRYAQQQPQHSPLNRSQSQGTQSEEYYDEEGDDEYGQDGPSPPEPVPRMAARAEQRDTGHASLQETHKIGIPVS